jgi:3'(2'), 5'-bisphosphate nucleotidase
MLDLKNPETLFAIEALTLAGQLARDVQHALIDPAIQKEDKSPVTVADFAVQALVSCLLERAFPNDVLVGEEDATALRAPENAATLSNVVKFVSKYIAYATPATVCAWIDRGGASPAKRFWTLDPIDGTKGFLRKDQYAVALALIENGKVKLGALACPNLVGAQTANQDGPGSVVVAARGQGCWTKPMTGDGTLAPLKVAWVSDAGKARVLRSFEAAHTNVDQLDVVLEALGNKAQPVRMDSQAKYAMLAAGKGDLLFRLLSKKQPDYREMIWDQAAGSIIVEEAGGKITDLFGKPLDFNAGRTLANNRGVLASNTTLHGPALTALAKI